ncbi:MAG: DUF262 domain-containing HNH endonuclease family protein [Nitrosopumilus sp.]|nr:DUF262 domain-containing HNH endonuclease family protein [Nitrosopumilus sp.]
MPTLDATSEVRSVREVLDSRKYGIDFFQREYKWKRRHIEQLLHDLETRFQTQYQDGDKPQQVKEYTKYYMGTIITSNAGQDHLIVDGQQRLTSITLLLIYLKNLQESGPTKHGKVRLDTMIFSEKYDERSYNLDIEDRVGCMDALYRGKPFTPESESEVNIMRAYDDIGELLQFQSDSEGLAHFIWWLTEKVSFVEISMASDDDAYSVFETMNDRGLSLTPTEMLKGYLLAKTGAEARESGLVEKWTSRISELRKISKDEDSEFFKSWLRAKYAISIRPGTRGAANEDFEIIGTRFHNWVRDNKEKIGLEEDVEDTYRDFLESRFDFYSSLYLEIHRATSGLVPGLEHVYYIENLGVPASFYYPALMAPVLMGDDRETVVRKMDMVARFMEMFYLYRKINHRTTGYSSVRHAMFGLIKEMRNTDTERLAALLKERAGAMEEGPEGLDGFRLKINTKKLARYILARITSHAEVRSLGDNRFDGYMSRDAENPYSIEHVLPASLKHSEGGFSDDDDLNEWRNRMGALLLMPTSINTSLGNLTYSKKLPYYYRENLLAKSLHPKCYEKNPSFTKYFKRSGLPFRSCQRFGKAEISKRLELYVGICHEIWDPKGFVA